MNQQQQEQLTNPKAQTYNPQPQPVFPDHSNISPPNNSLPTVDLFNALGSSINPLTSPTPSIIPNKTGWGWGWCHLGRGGNAMLENIAGLDLDPDDKTSATTSNTGGDH